MKVVVITARGLGPAHLGCYGNEWVETPAFDRLAAEGVVFDNHFADRPDTAGAWASWRSGRYHLPALASGDATLTAPEDLLNILKGGGVFTSLVRDGSRSGAAPAGDGWGAAVTTEPGDEGTPLEYALDAWQTALEALPADNWLLWLELATALPPWDVPEGYQVRYLVQHEESDDEADPDEEIEPLPPLIDPSVGPIDTEDDEALLRLQLTAAGAATYVDAGLGLVVQELERRGLIEDVLLVVTGDHGYPLGEHGYVGPYRPWPHEELTHVPLMMFHRGKLEAGRRVPGLTQSLDLMPTLLDAFGLSRPAVHGHSLLPLARGEAEEVRAYACSGLEVDGRAALALRSSEWTFLWRLRSPTEEELPPPQLHVRPDDRWEVNDVAQHHPERCEHLTELLREFVAATHHSGPLQPPKLRDPEAEEETST